MSSTITALTALAALLLVSPISTPERRVLVARDVVEGRAALPPGHPPIVGRLPPGHPPVGPMALPPGHPAIGSMALPPGHPPIGACPARRFVSPSDDEDAIVPIPRAYARVRRSESIDL